MIAEARRRELAEERYYMGERFRYAEVEPFLREHADGEATIRRFDPAHIYGWVVKPD